MGEQMIVPEVYALVAEWATLNGAESLSALPGLWERDLGEFRISINGHGVDLSNAEGLTVPPYHLVINAPAYFFAVLPDGSTVGEWAKPQLAIAYSSAQMPKSLMIAGPAQDTGGHGS